MTVTVLVPASLRPLVGGRARIELRAKTVAEALLALSEAHPALGPKLWQAPNVVRPAVGVFLNDDDVRSEEGLETALRAGDELLIVTAVSGG